MNLLLRIAGPDLDVSTIVRPGQNPLVIGRDLGCDIRLPDPNREVSRHHLGVWNEEGALCMQVLSAVKGVQLAAGEAPPGWRGALPPGESLFIADYRLDIHFAPDQSPEQELDPWDQLQLVAGPLDDSLHARPATDSRIEQDPFGDWGFETTFGPGEIDTGEMESASESSASELMAALFKGLGLDPQQVGLLSRGEMENMGQMVRMLALGTLQLHALAMQSRRDMRVEERTMVAAVGPANPLKQGSAEDPGKLLYLFGGQARSVGLIRPERALEDVLGELLAHEAAAPLAMQAAMEGALREFDPDALKSKLGAGGGLLFEAARAWGAYSKYYAERRAHLPQWAREMLDRYFAEAYLREVLPVRRGLPGG